MASAPDIAVILPCRNEATAVGGVIASFRSALPDARIYVYDNASTDDTMTAAAAAGGLVRAEPMIGKGQAITRAFADIDADIYVLADGDGTYEASAAPAMIALLRRETLDMVVGARAPADAAAFRAGHAFGNEVFSWAFRTLFRAEFSDILSGYRVLSRRFVKSFPSRAKGFEIELEMSAHAALLRLPVRELPTRYRARQAGGQSKLATWRDGVQILRKMLRFLRLHHPRLVFGVLGILLVGIGLNFFIPVGVEYLKTGLAPRIPTVIVSVAIMLAGLLLFIAGAILDAQAQYFAETKRLAYLSIPAPPRPENDE